MEITVLNKYVYHTVSTFKAYLQILFLFIGRF